MDPRQKFVPTCLYVAIRLDVYAASEKCGDGTFQVMVKNSLDWISIDFLKLAEIDNTNFNTQ